MYISDFCKGRDNNFNLLRFIAANLVLFSHSYPLSLGKDSYEPFVSLFNMTGGDIAVDLFFITSGFLITRSYFRKKSVLSYIKARVRRIYPALFVVILLSVFILGPVFTTLTLGEYFTHSQTYQYLLKNSFILKGVEYNLPGVFSNNSYPDAVNGSLWTLPKELKYYLYIVIFALTGSYITKFSKNKITVQSFFIVISFILLFLYLSNYFVEFKRPQKLLTFFFIGSCYYLLREYIVISSRLFLLFTTLFISALFFHDDLFFIAYTLFFPYIIFYLAYIPKGKIRSFNNLGDYSYGIYIYAFPIQQTLSHLYPNITVTMMVIGSFIITLFFAWLSWELIESKLLKLETPSTF